MAKTEIYGPNRNPLFDHLMMKTKTDKISWNFGKFLINTNKQAIDYFGAVRQLCDVESKISDLMENPNQGPSCPI